jgi:hypothetical protein
VNCVGLKVLMSIELSQSSSPDPEEPNRIVLPYHYI